MASCKHPAAPTRIVTAASWPKATDPADENATRAQHQTEIRGSRTLNTVIWNNSRLLKGNVAEEVQKLKAQDGGEIQVHGSGDLLPAASSMAKQRSARKR